jgi:LacI family transcriptional regulator
MLEKEVTIYDLAKLANVSASTVSRALRDDPSISVRTKTKIIELSGTLGYRPNLFASDLRTKKTNIIGVLVHNLGSQLMASIVSGIEQVLTNAGYNLVICHSSDSAEKEIECAVNLLKKRVDGIIASLAIGMIRGEHFNEFFKRGIPVVFFDRVEMGSPGTKIVIDNYNAGYQAAIHLIQQGCRNFMHITGSLERNVYADRWKGFQTALSQYGLHCKKDQLMIIDFNEKNSRKVAQQVLQRKELPDGIFITDDFCAAICVQHFKKADIRVPNEIAVIGFNNDVISRIIEPQLTTFEYPAREMGTLAAKSLIDQLSDGTIRRDCFSIELKSELLVRASSTR